MRQCLDNARDALFELTDAVLDTPAVPSLAHLPLSPVFCRRWRSVYEALQDGRPDREALMRRYVAQMPPHEHPPLARWWRPYLRRCAADHWYRFAKGRGHWTLPQVTTPEQSEQWSDLMPLITWELYLARKVSSVSSGFPLSGLDWSTASYPHAGGGKPLVTLCYR